MSRRSPVKLELHTSFFDLLMTMLERNATEGIPEIRDEAAQLLETRMRFSRPFEDSHGASCVRMLMYEKEAAELIWQLLLCVADNTDCNITREYSKELGNTRLEE